MKNGVPIHYAWSQILAFVFLLLTSTVSAQTQTIKGTIVDASSEPIIGASVLVEGTTNGGITDLDGNFTLMNVPSTGKLVVSFVGYQTQTVDIKGQTVFKLVLQEDSKLIDEVVVIGYGTTSTRKMASAVTAVKGEKLQDLPFTSVTASLAGRATGVIVQSSGGEPGSTPSISIRGGGAPLYVIDGVVSDSWDFNTLNPNDIESLSILKDAASLAVYGSRAANGIVMVKTKQGGKGKTAVTYTFNAEFSQPTKLLEKTRAYDYAYHQRLASINDGINESDITFTPEILDIIKNQSDPYRYADTDWLGEGLKSVAPQYKHTVALSGSGDKVNYYISLGMLDQGSIYTSDALNYNRYTVRSNINTTFDKIGLKVSLNLNGAYEKKEYPSFSGGKIWEDLYNQSPLNPAYNPDGTYAATTDHPLVEMDERSGYDHNYGKFINTQVMADWTLPWLKELTLGAMFNYRLNDSHLKNFSTKAPQYNQDGTVYPIGKPTLTEKGYWGEAYNFELSAAYVKTFAEKHSIDAKFVYTVSEADGWNFNAYRGEYLSTVVDQLFAGAADTQQNGGNSDEEGRMGFVGRLKYDYSNRYIVEGSFRYDGSDNFAPGHRWGFFPSGAVAWAVTEEPFFKEWDQHVIDLIKIRASYGQTGTESGVNRFGYLSTYNMDEKKIVIGGKLQAGFSEGDLVSPALLSWYQVNSLNYGLDMAFLKNRLTGTFDYFYYVTKGGLMSPGDRYITPLGKKLPQIKSDSEQRREGVELTMRWKDTTPRKLTYEVGFNMTYFNTLWKVKADEGMTSLMNPYKRQTNQTDYYGLGLLDTGLYQNIEDILNSPRRTGSTQTKLGDIGYQDVNGDGKIDGEDQVRLGMPTMPHFTYGIDFSLNYEGFTLSGLFYGTGKRFMTLGDRYQKGEGKYLYYANQLNYWREDNTGADFPRISMTSGVNGNNNQQGSTYWMRNAAYFRLKNLQLSYDFKYKLLRKCSWLQMCRVNLAGSNLFTISGISKFFDPETASTSGDGYPVQRVYSVGLTIGF
ncbi:SusC/RagA family TonB-linked outer membrane protein [Bacteroides sp.]|uniref:SusC/RagA family TonB-linked outer membrane protein n=1 Tax=Bacteroides sp. TaxID=29523 RepID=UPI0025B99B2A|nr:TonB-dependent receptor [Bacteroides sp.]